MRFIEMTGKMLADVVDDGELHITDLAGAGVRDDTIVRINEQGDIEVRRPDRWDVPLPKKLFGFVSKIFL